MKFENFETVALNLEMKQLFITAEAYTSEVTGNRELKIEAEGKALRMEMEVRNDR